jgi:pimeloyl-ACP methyl ester carboxylesterase
MGIAVSTARSHLKHVFAKTGTSKQAELVKMVLTNPTLTVSDVKAESSREDRNCLLKKLPSGRTISYAESGCPNGRPVLMCHPILSSRLIMPENQSILEELNIRLIVPDRPGFGFTSPAATCHSIDQWLEDMHYFIPQINASGCSLLGYSSGGAYAMALAATSPQLIDKLCLVSSIVPVHEKNNLNALLPLTRMIVHLARTNQNIAGSFLKLALNKAIRNPNSYFDHVFEIIPEHDQKLLHRDELKHMLVGAFEEGVRQGIDAINNEILFVAREWQIEPGAIRCPVTIWHGTDDAHAPFCNMEQFSANIPNLTTRHRVDQTGHYMMFGQWRNILNGIASGNHG